MIFCNCQKECSTNARSGIRCGRWSETACSNFLPENVEIFSEEEEEEGESEVERERDNNL